MVSIAQSELANSIHLDENSATFDRDTTAFFLKVFRLSEKVITPSMAAVKGHVEVFMSQRVADVGGRNSGAGRAQRIIVAANAPSAHIISN